MNRPLTIQEWFESLGKMVEEFDWKGNGMSEQDKTAPVEQEPVAWMSDCDVGFKKSEFGTYPCVPLYTHPKQWVGLTDDEIDDTIGETGRLTDFARAIEAKLKEKNT